MTMIDAEGAKNTGRNKFLETVLFGMVAPIAFTCTAAAQALTVPSNRLPAGCALAQSNTRYAGLRLPGNPWTGNSPSLVAEIRERVEGSPRPPDGPPMSPREAARFRLGLASGIEFAYVAVYQEAESQELIPVYGLKPAPGETLMVRHRDAGNPGTVRLEIGGLTVVATGRGPCFQAIAAFLKSLTR